MLIPFSFRTSWRTRSPNGVDPGSRAFKVKVELGDAGSRPQVRPGMFARVDLTVGRLERLTVPRSAVRRAGDLDLVLVLDGDRARQRLVTLGEERDGRVETLSGLAAGERVIVAPAGIADGDPVRAAP